LSLILLLLKFLKKYATYRFQKEDTGSYYL
jgi:hypothetical protein